MQQKPATEVHIKVPSALQPRGSHAWQFQPLPGDSGAVGLESNVGIDILTASQVTGDITL